MVETAERTDDRGDGSSQMSDYERRAWTALTEPVAARKFVPAWVTSTTARLVDGVGTVTSRVPRADVVEDVLIKVLDGVNTLTTKNGLRSVNGVANLESYRQAGHPVAAPSDVRRLDLSVCDKALPTHKVLHHGVAAVEGAATSLAITGAVVSTTVSGGTTAAVAIGAFGVDITVTMVGMGRIVGEIAAAYGYDPREPEEEIFALQVLGYSMAVGDSAKTASLAALSRLTQQMMRRATWSQLNRHQLVQVIQAIYRQLGLRLTQKKLGQAVPIIGVGLSVALNASLVESTHKRAAEVYRRRFLIEKYGLRDPRLGDVVVGGAEVAEEAAQPDAVVVDNLIAEVLGDGAFLDSDVSDIDDEST